MADNPPPTPESGRPARNFRWQALFQRTSDPLFVLDHRRRLRFVNEAWEKLTGMPRAEARGLVCSRPRPAGLDDPPKKVLAHALTPPADVLRGHPGRARRLLPGRGAARRWWEVEFFPLRQEGGKGPLLILGRVTPLPVTEAPGETPLPERLVTLRERVVRRHGLELLDSEVVAVRRLREQVRLAGQVTVPALLVGEPGTGKQTLARVIHFQGPGRERPFAALDCERLPPFAVAGLLFGERGEGQWETLGTLYLREPAGLPRDLQLRLCERIGRSGEGRPGPRVLAGCGRPPAEEVAAGRLLEELAGTLGTLVLEVPPLRRRRADLPGLVERMLSRLAPEGDAPLPGLTPAAWEIVNGYAWPGNLRELYAALASARGRASGNAIDATDLPSTVRLAVRMGEAPGPAERGLPLEELLERAERRLIELALRRTGGNQARAAKLLSVWPSKLSRRISQLGIGGEKGPGEGGGG